jgi:ABC-type dipeptide/oligopeptide/nickel transport system permease component
MKLGKYIAYRLGLMVISIFMVSIIVFFLVRLKGDPVDVMAPPYFSAEDRAELRRAWGFDKPLATQYIIFLRKAVTGDFGKSMAYRTDAMQLVLQRLGNTYILALTAAAVSLFISIPLGVISALKRGGLVDLLVTLMATVGVAMPAFWFGIVLIIIFSARLKWLPAFGAMEPKSIIMPALALGVSTAANLSRLTRSSMLEIMGQPYVTTARAKGLVERVIVLRHELRNALIPVVTSLGLQLGWLLGGSVVIEKVFSWPGLGRLMVDAITLHRDITIVQAGLLWFALSFLGLNLVVDILYTVLDPRIRLS